jgi:hypothetical protein
MIAVSDARTTTPGIIEAEASKSDGMFSMYGTINVNTEKIITIVHIIYAEALIVILCGDDQSRAL